MAMKIFGLVGSFRNLCGTEGVDTLRSHFSGPAFEDDGGLSSASSSASSSDDEDAESQCESDDEDEAVDVAAAGGPPETIAPVSRLQPLHDPPPTISIVPGSGWRDKLPEKKSKPSFIAPPLPRKFAKICSVTSDTRKDDAFNQPTFGILCRRCQS
ncbi:hypothetical protein B0H10DRAFT_2241311 [Mycena sp. CBHHK59/15]|nr:hypothetical protein B0H10DRAFT_2241311 [Mycena sp. CBHHK59/15]